MTSKQDTKIYIFLTVLVLVFTVGAVIICHPPPPTNSQDADAFVRLYLFNRIVTQPLVDPK